MSSDVTEGRPSFGYVTHDAIDALHAAFAVGESRTEAMAIIGALASLSSRSSGSWRGGDQGFTATRSQIAEFAGLSLSTLDRVTRRMADAGLLQIDSEHRTAPKTWTLSDRCDDALANHHDRDREEVV